MGGASGAESSAEALADLAEALAATEDEAAAEAAMAMHLAALGLGEAEVRAVADAAARGRDAGRAGQAAAGAVGRLAATLLAGHLRALRGEEQLAAWGVEHALFQSVIDRLNAAATMEEMLGAFTLAVPDRDAAEVALCTIEVEEGGRPGWLTTIGVLPPAGRAAQGQVGQRFYLPDIPFARVYLENPGLPVLIGSIADDPRIDDYAKSLWAMGGVQATILMTLTLRGQIVGLLAVQWPRPVALGPREQRLYQALSRQAALLLDNNVMIERLRGALAATQAQGQLLQTVLDHVPIGILCLDEVRRPIVTNRAVQVLLGAPEGEAAVRSLEAQVVYTGSERRIPVPELPGARAMVSGVMQTGELDLLRPDGTRRSLEVIGAPMRGASGKIDRVVVMLSDISGRRAAEVERSRLQEEVIRVQAAALAERSSPLIPITDDVLVMPLVGTIDSERGHDILDAVLAGARQRGARVTIIDVTGVPSIDTRAAAVLTGAARALRLLGVEAVLSGVGPEVAQALVSLDVPLAGIQTCGTLQVAIQYALRRLGRKI